MQTKSFDSIEIPKIPKKLIEFLMRYSSFIIASHKEPDGDCISSSIAMALFLQRLKKTTYLMSAGPFKRTEIKKYESLFSAAQPNPEKFNPQTTGCIIVDCSGLNRVGDIAPLIEGYEYIIIDHHATNSEKSERSLVMTAAPSTTYLIQSIIEEISGIITKPEAEILFFGLCTDTGFFRHLDDRSAEVFAHAARLVKYGANPKQIFMQMNGGKSFESRILISRILDRMQRHYDGRLITAYETHEDTKKYGLEGRDSDMLYQLIQSIEGVEAICVVRQESLTHCSVGFRSFDKIDVSSIALSFGGGGHKQASGLYIEGTIDELMPKFVEAFRSQMEND